ncbi:MAG: isoprenylcysteine carboxylmethyltransferase family protein [Candidatus Aminicenantes bacterium]|nr:isoprenylcysteine carboxylmethyltransferase family protein [Candidatus Aminicenantes bacterium]
MTKSCKEKLTRMIYTWRVRTGFLLGLIAVILARPEWPFILAGMTVCILGLLLRGWAAGYLRKEKELAVCGPYRFTRNPLYLGNFLLFIAISLASRSLWVAGLFLLYLLIFFPVITAYENRRMESLFPEAFTEYRKKVQAFLPTFRPAEKSKSQEFSWKNFKKNKELRASAGALIFWSALLLKMLFFS